MNDIFAAPSKEELKALKSGDIFAAPSKEELRTVAPTWKDKILDTRVPGGSIRGYAKGALESLPAAGAIAGGVIGTPADIVAGPLGTVAGAGIGGFLGKSLQNLGEKYILDEDKTRKDIYLGPVEAAAESAAGEGFGQSLGPAAKLLGDTKAGQFTKGLLSKVGDSVKTGAAKVGELFTGVPEQEIKTYAKFAPEIKAMQKASDGSTAEAADQIRSKFMDNILKFKGEQGSAIDQAIKNAPDSIRHDIKPIVEALEAEKLKYNPKANPEAIKGINNIIERVKLHTPGTVAKPYSGPVEVLGKDVASEYGQVQRLNSTGPSQLKADPKMSEFMDAADVPANMRYTPRKAQKYGPDNYSEFSKVEGRTGSGPYVNKPEIDNTVNPKDLNRIKNMLQDLAESAYQQKGEIFTEAGPSAYAAKSGARSAKGLLDEALPEVKAANAKLSELHDIESTINKNLIGEGRPEAGLLSAGNHGNAKNVKSLKRMSELIGDPGMQAEAEKLAAMRTFGSPKLSAHDTTGKAAGRMALAGGIGFLAGGPVGGVTASALTSPAALRTAIDAGQMSKSFIKDLLGTAEGRNMFIQSYINTPNKEK